MHGLFANTSLGLEALQFQGPAFFRELTLLFASLKKVPESQMADHELITEFGHIVRRQTGLSVVLVIDPDGPLISLPHVDRNHPLVVNWMRYFASSAEGQRALQQSTEPPRGSVNLRTGQVDGFFAQLPASMYFPARVIADTRLLAEEVAAIALHELGHLFAYFEYISRSLRTNQVLATLSKALDGSSVPEVREAALVGAKQALKLTQLDIQELCKATDTKVVEMVVISSMIRETADELGANVLDISSWEFLADQYAARQGAGRHMVIGLDKLERDMGYRSYRSTMGYVFYEALKFVLLVCPLFGLTFVGLGLMALDSDEGWEIHGQPEQRARRLRNELVARLKDRHLKPELVRQLQEDVAAVDEVLERVKDRRQLLGVIWDAVNPQARRQWNQTKLQKQLENLAASDLFVQAAKIKQLAA